jgi:thiol-disulfide isomerase/thioredoxin
MSVLGNPTYIKKLAFTVAVTALAAVLTIQTLNAGEDFDPEEGVFPVFGTGPVEVRIYSNYFCGPCRLLEPDVEPVLHELVANGKISLTFVDIPFPRAMPYIQYYLYAMNVDDSIEQAFRVRGMLFDIAAEQGSAEDIRKSFERERVGIDPFDLNAVFSRFNEMLLDDEIRSTPSAVLYSDDSSSVYTGRESILAALEDLK